MTNEGEKVRSIKRQTEENSRIIETIVDQLVHKFTKDLDDYIALVRDWLRETDSLSDHAVESITIRIPVFMYFAVSGLETLGIQKDMSTAIKTEVFNNVVIATEGTVRDKESAAENATLNEYLVNVAYDRAYRRLKAKLDVCDQLCQASRKVLGKRIAELDIDRMDGSRTNKTMAEGEQDAKQHSKHREHITD